MEIKPLFQIRYAPKNIVDFYYRNFDYIFFKADGYEGIPMVKLASLMINRGYYKEPFPFGEYARGFCEEYSKEIKTPYVICENTLSEVLISKILYRTGILPCEVELKKPEDRIINLKAVYDWGKNTAIEFKTWEKILETPQYFTDFYPFIEQKPAFEKSNKKAIPADLLKRIYPNIIKYMDGVNEKQFTECFNNGTELNVIDGWKRYLIYLFRDIWQKEGINKNTLEPVFGSKYKYSKAPNEKKRAEMDAIFRVIYPT